MKQLFKPWLVARFSSHHHSSNSTALKIGFIGLGNMGAPMAGNLAVKGFSVMGFDASQARYPEHSSKGLKMVSSVSEMFPQANLIFTMLPNSQIVKKLCEETLFPNLAKDSIIIDSSTISPLVAKELSEKANSKGLHYVDAPVSGGVPAATGGTLTFMVGTEDIKLFERIEKILQAMGKIIFKCGSPGSGQIAKMCNNLSLAIQMVSVAEALSLGKSLGINLETLTNVMKVSTARCWSIDTYNPVPGIMPGVPSSRNYENGFACELMLKDLNISKEVCKNIGKEPILGQKTIEMYEELVKNGLSKKDFSVVFDYIEKTKPKK
jgi:3-hydroxyisobutyrate dehydrogenase